MKKLIVLVLGLTLIWTNNVFAMDKAEIENQSIPITQLLDKTPEEAPSSSTARNYRKEYFDQWGSPENIIKDQCATCCVISGYCIVAAFALSLLLQ